MLSKIIGKFSSAVLACVPVNQIRFCSTTSPQLKKKIVKPLTWGPDANGFRHGVGRRKCATAQVLIQAGSGQFFINDKHPMDYFQHKMYREHAMAPILQSNTSGYFDVHCKARGGGFSGQSGAIRLGLARALVAWDPFLKKLLRSEGMMTRDRRVVERKKPGQRKARRKYQWVKR